MEKEKKDVGDETRRSASIIISYNNLEQKVTKASHNRAGSKTKESGETHAGDE